jgi:3-deoxy-manno-octulosonate cytidylyltransferase (CMP-KDO synthetase)|tara:strand:+ start:7170 stop:7931 length:762 start_codon:yes stop_codon:yes gene_type:complete
MQFIVVIPARYASTRLPGKPLRDIAGLPMIQRVWQQACKSGAARVVIATDDSRIEAAALAFGAEVCMTRADHVSGTDRLQEVAQQLGLDSSQIVVNVQGDEPLIPPRVIDQVASNLAANEQAGVATLCEPIESVEDFCNPNVVKVVTDVQGLARYFSRAPIPWPRDHFQESQNSMPELDLARRHIGIYAYRVAELTRFVSWAVAPIERSESLEQLRFIWNSVGIHIADAIEPVPGGIDTEQDLESAIKIIKSL